jgi:aryl-alcohol dehydrogenase-like predicted oxidoreductase
VIVLARPTVLLAAGCTGAYLIAMGDDDFVYRDLPLVNKRVHRLGLAFNYGIDAAGAEAGLAAGINYLFWTKFLKGDVHAVVKDALKRDRERYVLSSGATLGFSAGGVRRGAEKLLRSFDVDYIDVFHIFWLGKMSAFTKSVQRELVALREEGLVRALGVSIHDRPRAGGLASDSILDLLMIRYNAAHPGAESDIFPHYQTRRPLTVAYTATSWRKLLKAPRGWDGPVMSAGDCYRFCLSSPHVDVVLCGADSHDHLKQNLEALKAGPLSSDEDEWMRRFGKAVHG